MFVPEELKCETRKKINKNTKKVKKRQIEDEYLFRNAQVKPWAHYYCYPIRRNVREVIDAYFKN